MLLAASKSEELSSWAAAFLFGAVALVFAWATPTLSRTIFATGRRLPRPLNRLYPSPEREERQIRMQQRMTFWMGIVFVVVGGVGFLVRLLVP